MRIHHTALYAANLEEARDFFVTYFDAAASDLYHNPKTDFRSYFLRFADGAQLELMTKPGLLPSDQEAAHFGYAHLAFSVGSREEVDRLSERLNRDGYMLLSGPRVTGDGYYESCIRGIEGNLIEIVV